MKGRKRVPAYYPVYLNLNGRKCVVVGGGRIALRKVKALLEHGAEITVISPDLCLELLQLAGSGKIHALKREYGTGDLEGAFVAIAATDSREIHRQIVAEARKQAVLVNTVNDAENSDFIVPSYFRRGDVTVAVSTAGRSPALARKIRLLLERELGDEYALLANLISEVRSEVKGRKIKVDGDAWQEAIDLDVLLELLRRGEVEKARATLLNNLKARQK